MSKKKLAIWSVLAMLVLVFVTACGGKEKVDLGKVENGTYKNEYFGISFQVPQGWNVQDEETMRQVNEVGKEIAAGNDKTKQKQFDLAEQKLLNLAMASKFPMGEAVLNPSVISNAEKVSKSQVKTSKDYLEATKKIIIASQIPYQFKEITSVKVGGKDFDVLETSLSQDGGNLTQKIYSTLMNGYALNLIITYVDDESKAETDKLIESVSFK
ncbi:hypothetical protein E0485_19340 [Paenibacillus albiflavus]|uniref:Lipoprotein n=1 Tax=Paenibacillus albiflavus TaxID=2545760 RepID=A0A4R4E560_9BACL|nr:hypothetical protein [Paenibacillus albiflavus]TCZ74619.1 hypothetical protein E0485_19340 [Paenibacillus albiflavus]